MSRLRRHVTLDVREDEMAVTSSLHVRALTEFVILRTCNVMDYVIYRYVFSHIVFCASPIRSAIVQFVAHGGYRIGRFVFRC